MVGKASSSGLALKVKFKNLKIKQINKTITELQSNPRSGHKDLKKALSPGKK